MVVGGAVVAVVVVADVVVAGVVVVVAVVVVAGWVVVGSSASDVHETTSAQMRKVARVRFIVVPDHASGQIALPTIVWQEAPRG